MPKDIADNFVKWLENTEFTAGGRVFDVGGTCLRAIEKYENGADKGIGETNYNLFKSEFDRVKSLMDI